MILLVLLGVALADPTIYFKETFEDAAWKDRWVQSKHKSDFGEFTWSAGKFYGDAAKDKGIKTSQDARFYALSAGFDKFSNEGKTLVIQFTVKHEQNIDCGGGYVKLFPSTVDKKDVHGESPYNIMFGPDICGPGTKKVHVIFSYKGKNLLVKKEIRCKDDEYTHLYTLIVRPDDTYEVKIDNSKVESGSLENDFDFLPAKTIPDPAASKPSDWDDKAKIDDPSDTKSADWDKPEYIPDPDAKKPEDWDDDTDGEWEPPNVPNPGYKGEWKPKQIDNPKYQGVWVHPQVPNPEYQPDDSLCSYDDFGSIGFDIWQVKSGTIFDNVLITDDVEHAETFGANTWGKTKDAEKEMKKKLDEEQRKEEEAKRKAEEASKPKDDDDDDDEDDNDGDDDHDGHDHDGHDHEAEATPKEEL